jgi:hypothetical protein
VRGVQDFHGCGDGRIELVVVHDRPDEPQLGGLLGTQPITEECEAHGARPAGAIGDVPGRAHARNEAEPGTKSSLTVTFYIPTHSE